MVKIFTTLLLAGLVALLVYLIRRRLRLALTVGAVAYAVLLPVRLLFAEDIFDRLADLVWPMLAVAIAWLVLWRVSVVYERRKRARDQSRPGR